MKLYLLTFAFLLGVVNLMAQTPTVANLTATGTGIKWYASPTGGTPLSNSEVLINGAKYYASQTINGVESMERFEVTANIITVTAPSAGTHTPSQTQIVWNWNTVSGATGYKWGKTNVYYLFVGQQPTNSSGGYNGGGAGFSDTYSRGGGGATNQSSEIGGWEAGGLGGVGDNFCGHGATLYQG